MLLGSGRNGVASFYFARVSRCNSLVAAHRCSSPYRLLSIFCCRQSLRTRGRRHTSSLFGAIMTLSRQVHHQMSSRERRLLRYASQRLCGVGNSLVVSGLCHVRGNSGVTIIRGFCSRTYPRVRVGLSAELAPSRGTRGCCGSCHGLSAGRGVLAQLVTRNRRRTECVSSMFSTLSQTTARDRLDRVHGRL